MQGYLMILSKVLAEAFVFTGRVPEDKGDASIVKDAYWS